MGKFYYDLHSVAVFILQRRYRESGTGILVSVWRDRSRCRLCSDTEGQTGHLRESKARAGDRTELADCER